MELNAERQPWAAWGEDRVLSAEPRRRLAPAPGEGPGAAPVPPRPETHGARVRPPPAPAQASPAWASPTRPPRAGPPRPRAAALAPPPRAPGCAPAGACRPRGLGAGAARRERSLRPRASRQPARPALRCGGRGENGGVTWEERPAHTWQFSDRFDNCRGWICTTPGASVLNRFYLGCHHFLGNKVGFSFSSGGGNFGSPFQCSGNLLDSPSWVFFLS